MFKTWLHEFTLMWYKSSQPDVSAMLRHCNVAHLASPQLGAVLTNGSFGMMRAISAASAAAAI